MACIAYDVLPETRIRMNCGVNSPATEAVDSCMRNRSGTKKAERAALIVTARIARKILVIRGQKVMIDADLAALYDVPTKRLNEQVKRNPGRFPAISCSRLLAPSATS